MLLWTQLLDIWELVKFSETCKSYHLLKTGLHSYCSTLVCKFCNKNADYKNFRNYSTAIHVNLASGGVC